MVLLFDPINMIDINFQKKAQLFLFFLYHLKQEIENK